MQIRIADQGVNTTVWRAVSKTVGGRLGGKADLQMRKQRTMTKESVVWVCLSIKDVKHEFNCLIYK